MSPKCPLLEYFNKYLANDSTAPALENYITRGSYMYVLATSSQVATITIGALITASLHGFSPAHCQLGWR